MTTKQRRLMGQTLDVKYQGIHEPEVRPRGRERSRAVGRRRGGVVLPSSRRGSGKLRRQGRNVSVR